MRHGSPVARTGQLANQRPTGKGSRHEKVLLPTAAPTARVMSPQDAPNVETHGRTVELRWPIGEIADDSYGPGTRYVQLSVFHSGKQYCASAHHFQLYANGMTRTVFSFRGPQWRASEPCARYNARALQAYSDRVLARFRADDAAGNADIAALFGGES